MSSIMYSSGIKRVISLITLILFFSSNIAYGASDIKNSLRPRLLFNPSTADGPEGEEALASNPGLKPAYFFGTDLEGNKLTEMDNLTEASRGGKGAHLAEMAGSITYKLGRRKRRPIPVPPGFTITTEEARRYFDSGKQFSSALNASIGRKLQQLEDATKRSFGAKNDKPALLVSVRSGAAISMPGMMDTVLNLGLNDEVVEIFSNEVGERPAWDAYRRLVMMFGDVVLAPYIENDNSREDFKKGFDEIFEEQKDALARRIAPDIDRVLEIGAEFVRKMKDIYGEDIEVYFDEEKPNRINVRSPSEDTEEQYRLSEVIGIKDTDLTVGDLRIIVSKFKAHILEETEIEFPQDPDEQLMMAIKAVFDSSYTPRAKAYRRLNNLPADIVSAVNVQTMVLGNLNDNSATGVGFTRDPSTGENILYGEWLRNAQGEDVVAGVRTPMPIREADIPRFLETHPGYKGEVVSLERAMPKVYRELLAIREALEGFYGDMQDFEFTIENGKLWMLQTRRGQRSAEAGLRIIMELLKEGVIDKDEAITRFANLKKLVELMNPRFDPKDKERAEAKGKLIAKGLPASPGAAVGKAVFDKKEAVQLAKQGEDSILTRQETTADDLEGMAKANGILTSRGGMTSHAAVVARGMGKAGVVSANIAVNQKGGLFITKDGTVVSRGEVISFDGSDGKVYLGPIKTMPSLVMTGLKGEDLTGDGQRESFERFKTLIEWVDERRGKGTVRANAEKLPEVIEAIELFGADGIGLARTEHMFFEDAPGKEGQEDRLFKLRRMLVMGKMDKATLDELSGYQTEDLKAILRVLKGRPITIRAFDPPIHEFSPDPKDNDGQEAIKRLAEDFSVSEQEVIRRIDSKREVNPMAGLRGARLGVVYPEIYIMQFTSQLRAYKELKDEGRVKLSPIELEIPLIGANKKEFEFFVKMINDIAKQFDLERGKDYKIGTMIEVPAAAVIAGEIAMLADFMSFGTNDFTQLSATFSRDDAGKVVIPAYMDEEKGLFILNADPFINIHHHVGELMRIAVTKARRANPDIEIGICGEHGGDPTSILKHVIPAGVSYTSCSPRRIFEAKLAVAVAVIEAKREARELVGEYDLDKVEAMRGNMEDLTPVHVNTTEQMLTSRDTIGPMRRLVLTKDEDRKSEFRSELEQKIAPLLGAILEEDNQAFIRLFNLGLGRLFEGRIIPKETAAIATDADLGEVGAVGEAIKVLSEANPTWGNIGVRQALTGYPEIFEAELRAIARLMKKNKGYNPRIIVPKLIDYHEFQLIRDMVDRILHEDEFKGVDKARMQVGASIDTVWAALGAGNISEIAVFIIFDSALTESAIGTTREDAPGFLGEYIKRGIYEKDPFEVTPENVAWFIEVAMGRAKEANPEIPMYVAERAPKAAVLASGHNVKSSRRQEVDSMDQIIAIPASEIIENREGFEKWINAQPDNIAVVIIAMKESEYEGVKVYEDIAYIKLLGRDISEEHRAILTELFWAYSTVDFFGGLNLGKSYYEEGGKFKELINQIARGV